MVPVFRATAKVNGQVNEHDGVVHEPEPVNGDVKESRGRRRGRAAEACQHGDDAGQEALGVVRVEIHDCTGELKDVHESAALEG